MKKGRAAYNAEFAAKVLADATLLGGDQRSAEKHGVSRRTVDRYRARLDAGDNELSQLVEKKLRLVERSWHRVRNRGLTVLVERMIALAATETDFDKVTRATMALGELDMAGAVLNVGGENRSEGTPPPEDEGGGEPEAGDPVDIAPDRPKP